MGEPRISLFSIDPAPQSPSALVPSPSVSLVAMELAYICEGRVYACVDLDPSLRGTGLRECVKKTSELTCRPGDIRIFSLKQDDDKWPTEESAATRKGEEIKYTHRIQTLFPHANQDGCVHFLVVVDEPGSLAHKSDDETSGSDLDVAVNNYNTVCERSRKRRADCAKLAFSKFNTKDINLLFYNIKRVKYKQEETPLPKKYLDHLKAEFDNRIEALGEPWTASESQRRVFINSVLITCVIATNARSTEKLSIRTEMELSHSEINATGKADYVISKGDHMVVVIEAKKCDIGQGQEQNFAAMEAARLINRKKNSSWRSIQGICTDFQNWVFIKRNSGELALDHDSTAISSTFTSDMLRIASKVYGMLIEL